jgi:GNAT superfamily N-acetyltransferase
MPVNPMDPGDKEIILAAKTDVQPQGTFWMLELNQPLPTGPAPNIPVVFMRASSEVVQELGQAMGLDDPSLVLQRLARGCHCYIARIEGRLATYGWVTFDEESIGELGLSFRLQAGETYIWDCATLPTYRGLRLYPALLAYILRELQHQGQQRVWIGADSDNLASQSGLTLVGFQPIADVFVSPDPTINPAWIRGRPNIPEQLITEVRQALHLI